jgi:hypothetical protein
VFPDPLHFELVLCAVHLYEQAVLVGGTFGRLQERRAAMSTACGHNRVSAKPGAAVSRGERHGAAQTFEAELLIPVPTGATVGVIVHAAGPIGERGIHARTDTRGGIQATSSPGGFIHQGPTRRRLIVVAPHEHLHERENSEPLFLGSSDGSSTAHEHLRGLAAAPRAARGGSMNVDMISTPMWAWVLISPARPASLSRHRLSASRQRGGVSDAAPRERLLGIARWCRPSKYGPPAADQRRHSTIRPHDARPST